MDSVRLTGIRPGFARVFVGSREIGYVERSYIWDANYGVRGIYHGPEWTPFDAHGEPLRERLRVRRFDTRAEAVRALRGKDGGE